MTTAGSPRTRRRTGVLRLVLAGVATAAVVGAAGCTSNPPAADQRAADQRTQDPRPHDPRAADQRAGEQPDPAPADRDAVPDRDPTPSAGSGPSGPARTACPAPTRPAGVPAGEQHDLDTRLIAATWRRDADTVRSLVCRGADVNHKDETEQSAYLITTSEGQPRLLDLMLRHGADVDSLDSYHGTGLIRAAERGHAGVVGRLLQEPVAVDHVNELGWTALLEAVVLGDGTQRYVDTVRALVAGRADVTIPAVDDGLTPLQHAEALGQDEVASTLRRAEAADRRWPADRAASEHRLLRAARTGDADAVAIALRHGARVDARDGRGRTAQQLAARNDRTEVTRLLVALAADPRR